MHSLRILFMGTPDFSVPTLEALLRSEHEVIGVFCQPDKAKGRGQKLQMPPTKEVALAHGIPVYQPKTLKEEAVQSLVESLHPDMIVVIAYGKILPAWMLTLPPYGCINLHASLLPKYRGAAPIQWSILEGDTETGITIMQMDEGMDTGAILELIKTPIFPEETSGELFDRLATLGGEHVVASLHKIVTGQVHPQAQDHEKATYTSKITKEMGLITWSDSAEKIHCQVRGLAPWPGAYTYWQGQRMRIWKTKVVPETATAEPGTITDVTKNDFTIATGKDRLAILEIQMDNKKRMAVSDFLKGHNLETGCKFDQQ